MHGGVATYTHTYTYTHTNTHTPTQTALDFAHASLARHAWWSGVASSEALRARDIVGLLGGNVNHGAYYRRARGLYLCVYGVFETLRAKHIVGLLGGNVNHGAYYRRVRRLYLCG